MVGLYTRPDGVHVTVRECWFDKTRLLVCPWDGPCVSRPIIEVSDAIIRRQLVTVDDFKYTCPHGLVEDQACSDCAA
jgi:hypothetical protein